MSTGWQGYDGVTGIIGYEGFTGIQIQGPEGLYFTGCTGDSLISYTGPTGENSGTGPSGYEGWFGYTGNELMYGAYGSALLEGLQAMGNLTGPDGISLSGMLGMDNLGGGSGPQGTEGMDKKTGPQGIGWTGPAGDEGPDYRTGPSGPQGPTGPNSSFVHILTGLPSQVSGLYRLYNISPAYNIYRLIILWTNTGNNSNIQISLFNNGTQVTSTSAYQMLYSYQVGATVTQTNRTSNSEWYAFSTNNGIGQRAYTCLDIYNLNSGSAAVCTGFGWQSTNFRWYRNWGIFKVNTAYNQLGIQASGGSGQNYYMYAFPK